MHQGRFFAVLLILALGVGDTPAAESWRTHLNEGRTAQRDRNWIAADQAFQASLDTAREQEAETSAELEVFDAWIQSAFTRGRKDLASDLMERAVELRRETGAEPVATFDLLLRLANTLNQVGPYEKAEAYFRQAIDLHESIDDGRTERLNGALRGLNTTLTRLRPDDEEREQLLLRNLSLEKNSNHHFLLGTYYRTSGRHEQALQHYREAIAQLEQQPSRSRAMLGFYLTAMGKALQELGRTEEAEFEYFRALEMTETRLGPAHPQLSNPLKRIGSLYLDQERFAEAEGFLRRALEIEQVSRGDEPDPCGCNVREMLQRVEQGLAGRSDSADLSRNDPPAEEFFEADPRLARLAELDREIADLKRRGEFEAGLVVAHQALELRREIDGPKSARFAEGQRRISRLLVRRTRREDAVQELKRYVEIQDQLGQSDSRQVADALKDLATSLRSLGQREESVPFYLREIEIREARGQRLIAAQRLESLGHVSRTIQEHAAARSYYDRAVSLWITMAGEQTPEIVRLQVAVATSYSQQERFEEAEALLSRLMDRTREADEPYVRSQVLRAVRDLYRKTGRDDQALEIEARLNELQ